MTRRATPRAAPRRASVRAECGLDDVAQTLEAIRSGEVDTLLVRTPGGDRVFTLDGADRGCRVLLEVMTEGVAKLTQQGLVTYCNARFASILGLPLERTIGLSFHDLVVPQERERFAALVTVGSRDRGEGEFRLQAPEAASEVPVRLSVVPLTLHGAESHCLVMTDLTEQRRRAQAITAERAEMQARLLLADRMATMGTLAAGVAHEVNNPLAYVLASIELMIGRLHDMEDHAGARPSEHAAWFRRQLERAREGATRIGAIVKGLRTLSRADDETITIVDLRRVLDVSISLVSNEIRHSAELVRDYEGLPPVHGNEARLGQVFVNLLVNAAQAIAPGAADRNEIRVYGSIDLTGRAVVEIHDTGCGIAPDDLPRVFLPFFTTKAVGLGTGLGLAICHGIVSSLGGQITAESTPGAGSTFRVLLPIASTIPQAAEVNPDAGASPTDSRGRVLVVDDEPDLCEALQEVLEPLHDVVTTTDARRALEWVAAGERFDVILCDMRMPQMTGLDFYRSLTTANPEQACRVVLMSGDVTRIVAETTVALPSPTLYKPFDSEQVQALIRDVMLRNPRPAGNSRQVDGCEAIRSSGDGLTCAEEHRAPAGIREVVDVGWK